MNLDYFIVYIEEDRQIKNKIGLFVGTEDDLKNLISKLIDKSKQLIFREIEIYQDYKSYIKQFISTKYKSGIKNSELTRLVLEESYEWLKKLDKLACNLHMNPNSGKIVMETINWNWCSIVPHFSYEKIEVLKHE